MPALKKALEKVLIHIKLFMFESTGTARALTIGRLKHKNLLGEEMPSQVLLE